MTTRNKKKPLLVTTALPYANGPLHLGHLVEAIQADIWVRFHKMQGIECYFISGSDAHGTSIMLSAEKHGTTPESQIEKVHQEHHQDFENFLVHFDNFYTTHSPENEKLSRQIYLQLKEKGDIVAREISQAFDPKKQLFLADRFISGECPRCGAKDQHGDSCEECGATYHASELINPYSKLSGEKPIQKKSVHYFFQLSHYETLLKAWLTSDRLQPHVLHKLQEWFQSGLRDWDISRDAPYFGFEIPDAPGKYFYVWLDAPIGYMASFKNLCQRYQHPSFEQYWQKESSAELYHFIGKDIVYFHSLFWPAMLESAGYRLPTAIFVHGFLTINGKKMSKSRGTFITAKQYAKHLPPEYLRYYVACKLTDQVEDIDLNFNDFMTRVNADLVGKYVNLASRCAGFIKKQFNLQLADSLPDEPLFKTFVTAGHSIAEHYQKLNYNRAIHEIMRLADQANQYIDQHKPWQLVKEEKNANEVHAICTQGINLFRLLTLYLKPILPETAIKVETFLKIPPLCWDDQHKPLLDQEIMAFEPLLHRVTPEEIAELYKNDIL